MVSGGLIYEKLGSVGPLLWSYFGMGLVGASAEILPTTPRINSLVSLRPSPLETNADVIW